MDDHLFTEGAALFLADLAGTVSESPLHEALKPEVRDLDRRLVLLGLRLTTQLGAGENHGYGFCSFQSDGSLDWAAEIQQLTGCCTDCQEG